MRLLFTFLFSLAIFSGQLFASEDDQLNEADLIKLRIKELELKKEVLQMEQAKQQNTPTNNNSVQPFVSPQNFNSGNAQSNGYIRGPRGGCYTFTKSGNKRYVDRSLCN